jgi:hypothetical protein
MVGGSKATPKGAGQDKSGRARMKDEEPRDYTIEALDNGLKVLLALGTPEYIELSLKDLAESLKLTTNITFRILKTLERHQMVESVDGKWQIAPAITRFSHGYMRRYERRVEALEREKKDHLG